MMEVGLLVDWHGSHTCLKTEPNRLKPAFSLVYVGQKQFSLIQKGKSAESKLALTVTQQLPTWLTYRSEFHTS